MNQQIRIIIYVLIIGVIATLIYQINTAPPVQMTEDFATNHSQWLDILRPNSIIYLKNGQFNPPYLSIPLGSSVTWVNLDCQRCHLFPHSKTHSNQSIIVTDSNTSTMCSTGTPYIFMFPGRYTYRYQSCYPLVGTLDII